MLQEAHCRVKEKGKSGSDGYLEAGIEDLSHFSFALKNLIPSEFFKKEFQKSRVNNYENTVR